MAVPEQRPVRRRATGDRVGRRRVGTVVAAAVVVGLSGVGGAGAHAAGSSPGSFTDRAAAQIAALQQIKSSLTPAERKLDSRLVLAERRRTAKSALAAVPRLSYGVAVTPAGQTTVDITTTGVTNALLARLSRAGAQVVSWSQRLGTARVTAPLSALTTIASWGQVTRVAVPAGYATEAAGQGSVVSEGDRTEGADVVRRQTHVTGVGVKVCALSDGVDSLADAQATGDLPAVDVLPFQDGVGDEGTAMLEIIHDLAPGASLGFATADNGESSFADNIRALRFTAHCDVIVDDVIYFHEDPFQDGAIAQSVNAVTADGALYFSSAGNEGNTIDGTSGNYEATFVSSHQPILKFVGQAHDFDPGTGAQLFEPLSDFSNDGVPVMLWWADPLGKAKDDYDLYLLDADGNVISVSQDVQDGSQDPFEILGTGPFGGVGLRVAVVKYSGAARYFKLTSFRLRFSDSTDGLVARATPGTTWGHSAAVNAFSVAAAPAAAAYPNLLEPGDPPNPAGPFPNLFTKKQKPERFTSDGPRRVFFRPDGTALTPGNFTATGGTVRQKPDVTAADGVSTSVPHFAPFFGTSAAAPHAAAIGALVLSGNPGASASFVRQAFDATALDLAPAGRDNRTGHGLVRADLVIGRTGATPQPLVVAGAPSVTVTTGDGDPFLEHGESARLTVPVTNQGDGRATAVNVRLSTGDPLATVTPASRSYGTIAVGATKTQDFTLSLAPGYPKGKPVSLAATVTFAGGLSPTTAHERVPTGQPGTTARTFAYGGPPVAIPDLDLDGVSVPITVSGIGGYGSSLTFSVDGQSCTTAEGATTVGIDHTFVEDLRGVLVSPSGRRATLFARSGGSGNNMCQVVFDDAAAKPFSNAIDTDAPYTGSWSPVDPLAGLLDVPVDGTWTFHVTDEGAADTGSIRAVSLHLTGYTN